MKQQTPLIDLVGFDYALAMKHLASRIEYARLAERIGYESKGSITKVLNGATPSHRHGEAIWALYLEIFGQKPPMRVSSSAPPTPKTGV